MYVICFTQQLHQNWRTSTQNYTKEDATDFAVDYVSFVSKIRQQTPDILIIPYREYMRNTAAFNIFGPRSILNVPRVMIAVESADDDYEFSPSNYEFCKIDVTKPEFQKSPQQEEPCEGHDDVAILAVQQASAQAFLGDLGFDVRSSGTIFISQCIASVVGLNCRPVSLNKTVYPEVSQRNHTSLTNMMRCIRTSLDNAWRHRQSDTQSLDGDTCFGEFLLRPTIKEFIYYVASKISGEISLADQSFIPA